MLSLSIGVYENGRRHAPNVGQQTLHDAWRRVQEMPRDKNAWAELADAQAAMDDLQAASHSYETALRLDTSDVEIMARYGFALYAQGRDDEALHWLERAEVGGARVPMLTTTLGRLKSQRQVESVPKKAELPQSAPLDVHEQPCFVALSRPHQRGPFIATVVIAGEPQPLIVDTGATMTTLDATLAAELGLNLDRQPSLRAVTATGIAEFKTTIVPALSIGGRATENAHVAICNGCGGTHARGLLGLDILQRLGLELQQQANSLQFTSCQDE